MIARLFLSARPAIDPGAAEAIGDLRAQEQMVDPESRVALPAARGIIPESVEPRIKN